MKVNRIELLHKLKTCNPGVETKKVSLEGMDCFIFKNNRIHTYNGSISVSVPYECDLDCAVPAIEFYKYISSFKGKEVTIEKKDTGLLLTCGRAKVEINYVAESVFKQIMSVFPPTLEWETLPSNFHDALSHCFIRNTNIGIADKTDGIYIDTDGVYSTDRVVINHVKLEGTIKRMWLTSKMVSEILKYDSVEEYAFNDSWVILKSGEIIFACRKYIDTYPIDRIKEVIRGHDTARMHGEIVAEFGEAVHDCLILAEEKEERPFINLEFQNDGIRVFSSTVKGAYSAFVEMPVESWEHITLCIDGNRLIQALKREVDPSFFIGYIDGEPNALVLHKSDWTELFLAYKGE